MPPKPCAARRLETGRENDVDLLVVFGLIAWIVASMRKKNKAPSRKRKKDLTAQEVTRKAQQLCEEAQSRMAGKQQKAFMREHEPLAEGESHAAPNAAEYMGSLHETSTEGEDLCDPELEHSRPSPDAPDSVYAGEIGREPMLDFSAKGLYQGIVMSEILARPSRRARRGV